MELLCDSHHGQYIPQIMARRLFDAGWSGITLDDVIQLEIDPYEGGESEINCAHCGDIIESAYGVAE